MTQTWLETPLALCRTGTRVLEALQPAAQLAARVYVGAAFFRSGLTKIADWDTTLALFQDEVQGAAAAAASGCGHGHRR